MSSKRTPQLFVIALLLVMISPVAFSNRVNTDIIQNEEVVIHFEKPLQNVAKVVADIYPDVKVELEKALGWKLDFRPVVVIIKDRKAFRKMAGSDLVVAFAVPGSNLIIIDYSRMDTHPFTLEATLKHELSHLLLHYYIDSRNLPKWLNEGVSQWVSGGMAEIIMGKKKVSLRRATLSRELISLKDLAERFPEDKEALLLAYEESKSIVEYINREFGTSAIPRILHYLENGDEVDVAVQKSLSIPLEELEGRWQIYLREKTLWIIYLGDNLYTILFFFAALITIYGFIRLLIKKRMYKDEDEDENGYYMP